LKDIVVQKLNESFTIIDAEQKTLKSISDYLKVERPGAFFDPLVKAGYKSPYDYFAQVVDSKLLVMNGHLGLLKSFGIDPSIVRNTPEFSHEQLDEFCDEVFQVLPFQPYKYQIRAFYDCIIESKQISRMCTGCLDGESEIEVFSNKYSDDELLDILSKL